MDLGVLQRTIGVLQRTTRHLNRKKMDVFCSCQVTVMCIYELKILISTFDFQSGNIPKNVVLFRNLFNDGFTYLNIFYFYGTRFTYFLLNVIYSNNNTGFWLFTSSGTIATTKAGRLIASTNPTTSPTTSALETNTRDNDATTAPDTVTVESITRVTPQITVTLESTSTATDATTTLKSTTAATYTAKAQTSASVESTSTATETTSTPGMQYSLHGPFARYAKLWVAHAPGMPGTFSPPSWVIDPGMHRGTCVTHVPWCIPGSITSNWFPLKRVAGKTFPAFPAHAQPAILRIWQEAHDINIYTYCVEPVRWAKKGSSSSSYRF